MRSMATMMIGAPALWSDIGVSLKPVDGVLINIFLLFLPRMKGIRFSLHVRSVRFDRDFAGQIPPAPPSGNARRDRPRGSEERFPATRWIVRPQFSRRNGGFPEPLLQSLERLRIAERPHSGRQKISQDTEREYIASRIAPRSEDLLRRHVRRGAVWQPEFLVHQVGELGVMSQAEIDQDNFAIGPNEDIRRFDIEMDNVLSVNIVDGSCNLCSDADHLFIG